MLGDIAARARGHREGRSLQEDPLWTQAVMSPESWFSLCGVVGIWNLPSCGSCLGLGLALDYQSLETRLQMQAGLHPRIW